MTTSDLADRLVAYVPHLRRHARLLCGSQQLGDEYVQVCLELIAEEPGRLDRTDSKRSLFQLFHSIWTVINSRLGDTSPFESIDPTERLEKGLQELAPVDRHALLLKSVDGFSIHEVAEILGLPRQEVERSLEQAEQRLARWTSANILIIEDESIIALELEALVNDMGHSVVGTARYEREALAKALDKKPELVLADIQLADNGSGINAVEHILEHIDVPVIFVTGFPERLLTGGRTEPAFLIAKPYAADSLKAMIAHVLALYEEPDFARQHRTQLIGKLAQIVAQERSAEPPRI